MTRTTKIRTACAAAKSHELLTARILRFIESAQMVGMATNVDFDGYAIRLDIDQEPYVNTGICRFSVAIIPGAWSCPALQLSRLRTPHGCIYYPEKSWPHPSDEAFAELLKFLTPGAPAVSAGLTK